jgi:ABC-type nitrate/sulfonate/bicarbonate transport system substrate-binding protein
MPNLNRRNALTLGAGALVGTLLPVNTMASQPIKIRVGGNTEPTMIGIAKGWFSEAGLQVEVTELPNILQYSNILASGSIDLFDGYLPATFWNMVLAGADYKIIAGSAMAVAAKDGKPARNARAYVARKDLFDKGEVKTVKDFKNRKIADFVPVPPKGKISPFPVGHAIFGETYREIDWTYLPNETNIIAALENKYVDGARLTTRAAKVALEKGIAVEIAKETDYVPEIQVRLVVARGDFIAANRDAVIRYLKVRLKAQEYIAQLQGGKHKEEFLSIAEKTSKTPPNIALDLVEELEFTDRISVKDLQDQQIHFVKVGIQKAVIPLDKVLDSSLLAGAKK